MKRFILALCALLAVVTAELIVDECYACLDQPGYTFCTDGELSFCTDQTCGAAFEAVTTKDLCHGPEPEAFCTNCECEPCHAGYVGCELTPEIEPCIACVTEHYITFGYKHTGTEAVFWPVDYCSNAVGNTFGIDQGQNMWFYPNDGVCTEAFAMAFPAAPFDQELFWRLGCTTVTYDPSATYPTCDHCLCEAPTCPECIGVEYPQIDTVCGWCSNQDTNAPLDGVCLPDFLQAEECSPFDNADINALHWSTEQCPTALTPACDQYGDCQSCIEDQLCGWCASTCCCTEIPAVADDAVCYDFDNMFLLSVSDCPENRLIPLDTCRTMSEANILAEFYAAVGGPGKAWIDAGWAALPAGDMCTLDGVVCNGDGTHVTDLDLSAHGLDGMIPESLGCLEYIQYLTLNDNPNLSGLVPATLVHYKALKNIMLSNNNLSGPLPAKLGELFDSMQYFYAAGNHLGCFLPASYGDWEYLREIHLEENCFRGDIPTEYASWASNDNFEEAHFECNAALADPDAAFQAQFAADELYIPSVTAGCTFQTDCQYCEIGCWRNPTCDTCLSDPDLECGWCYDDTVANPAVDGSCIAVASAADCPTDFQFAELICPTAAAPLCSTYTDCGTCVADVLCGWCASTCCCTEIPAVADDAVCYDFDNMFLVAAADCPENRFITLDSCRNDYTTADILAELYAAVGGPGKAFVDAGWAALPAGDVCTLTGVSCNNGVVSELDLSGKGLEGVLPESLGCLEFLQYLQLQNNPLLGGLVPSTLVHHLALKNLNFSNDNFSGPLPAVLSGLADSLQYFYVAGNHLGCELPAEYSQWANLREIHLQSNCFVGSIPADYVAWSANTSFEEAHFECNAALADPSASFQAQFQSDELYIPSVTAGCTIQTCQFC
jgi:hypothetical protein